MCYTDRQIDNRLRKLAELETKKKELETQIKIIQDEIKNDLGNQEQRETDHFLVRFTTVISNRFDTTSFKKNHSKLYNDFCRPSESKRFSYKALA